MAADIDDDIRKFGQLVSVELAQAIQNNINYLIESVPVGSIVMIIDGLHVNQPAINPTIFQLCNGALITETLSPLVGQATPNLTSLYLRATTNLGAVGSVAGSHTRNLNHNHTGVTNVEDVKPSAVDDSSSRFNHIPHSHPVPSDGSSTQNYEPSYVTIKHYLKIR